MHILVAGVRQRKAPIAVREQFSLSESTLGLALAYFQNQASIAECVILTTCNRTEIYLAVEDTEAALEAVERFYADVQHLDIRPYRRQMFQLLNEDAANHLFRVASGLDSLILGEGQILAQVKDALTQAQQAKSQGKLLDRLFKTAIGIGKRVRTETGIAAQDASVSRAAYEFAKQRDPEFLNRRIALIGGGKMAELIMTGLKQDMTPEQQQRVAIINRSPNRLKSLTERFGFRGLPWEALSQEIAEADVLFVATGAPHIVLDAEDFPPPASGIAKLVIDISVPRNVDTHVGTLPHVTLFNTDDLATFSGLSFENQQNLMSHALAIINEELRAFHQWRVTLPARRDINRTITQLQDKLERIRQAEVQTTCGAQASQDYGMADMLSRNLVKRILHDPLVGLNTLPTKLGQPSLPETLAQQTELVSHLFRLEDESPASATSLGG